LRLEFKIGAGLNRFEDLDVIVVSDK
jgi:hypothetical protein